MPSTVAVVGDGPAGSALARQLTLHGADVVLFGEDRPWDATYTTWVDDLDGVSVIDAAAIWLHRFESVAVDFGWPMMVQRSYGVIDNQRLRSGLRDGVAHDIGRVVSASDTRARIVIDATGWPSGLDDADRCLVERERDGRGRRRLESWYRNLPKGHLENRRLWIFLIPTCRTTSTRRRLVYAFPVVDGWLIEETVLAGPAVDPDSLLPRLASRLGESVEHLLERAVRLERVRIPMGASVQTRPGRRHAPEAGMATVRFGGCRRNDPPCDGVFNRVVVESSGSRSGRCDQTPGSVRPG